MVRINAGCPDGGGDNPYRIESPWGRSPAVITTRSVSDPLPGLPGGGHGTFARDNPELWRAETKKGDREEIGMSLVFLRGL